MAAGHERTAEAAAEVLRAGGNAYDAALAAVTTACVAEPVLASLGGGGFLLAAPSEGPARLYDFFVHTPRRCRPAAEIDFYPIEADFGSVTQEFHIGRGTFAVPGLVRGLFAVHRDLASVPMRELVEPALALAREGVEVTPFQAYLFEVVAPTFTATAAIRAIFGSARPGRALVGAGERLRQPELADALEALAHEGEALFYRGEIGRAILAELGDGGQVDGEDLAAYRAELRRPLALGYHGARILTNPPPASGGLLVGFALRLLEPLAVPPFASLEHLAGLAEAIDLSAEARLAACGEAGLVSDTTMLDAAFLARYRTEIEGRLAALRGTTHVSVIDGDGNLAAVTVSNGEGCGHVAPGTGIVLNNMLGEEDLNPGGFQRWPRAHRMTSMMAPTALAWPDGRRVATGSGGSNRIRSALLQVLVALVDHGLPIEAAVQAPRIHYERGLLSLEGGLAEPVVEALCERYPRHHRWEGRNMFFGGAHTVERDARGALAGAADPRRGGASAIA